MADDLTFINGQNMTDAEAALFRIAMDRAGVVDQVARDALVKARDAWRSVPGYAERGAIPLSELHDGLRIQTMTDRRVAEYRSDLAGPGNWTGLFTQDELINRALQTGTQPTSTIEGLDPALAALTGALKSTSDGAATGDAILQRQVDPLTSIRIANFRATALSSAALPMVALAWDLYGILPLGWSVRWGDWSVDLDRDCRSFNPVVNWDALRPMLFMGNSMSDINDVDAGGNWGTILAARRGVQAIGPAKYSQGQQRQALRVGLLDIFLTVVGDTLPVGGTSVNVTAINGAAPGNDNPDSFLNTSAGDGVTVNNSITGWAAGRHVTVSIPTGGSAAYKIVADAGSTATAFPPGTLFIPDFAAAMGTSELHIDVGRINPFPAQPVYDVVDAAVRRGRGAPITVWPTLPADGDSATDRDRIIALNTGLAAQWPRLTPRVTVGGVTYDLLGYMQFRGGASVDPRGNVPPQYHKSGDTLHFNTAGNTVRADFAELWFAQRPRPPVITAATIFNLFVTGKDAIGRLYSRAAVAVTTLTNMPPATSTSVPRPSGAPVEATLLSFDDLASSLRGSQVIGEPTVVSETAEASDSTWIFDQPVLQPGAIGRIRIGLTAGSTVKTFKVRRYTKDGTTFNPIANSESIVAVAAGYQALSVNLPVAPGEYIGLYTGAKGLSYVINQTGTVPYWVAAGDVTVPTVFTRQGSGTIRLEVGFDISYLVVNAARVDAIEARAVQLDARTLTVEGVAATAQGMVDGLAQATRAVQTIGRPAADGIVIVNNGAGDRVYVFPNVLLGAGYVRTMRIAIFPGAPAAGVPVYVQRWARVGNAMTKVAEKLVKAFPGLNTISLGMPAAKNDLIGIYAGGFASYSSGTGIGIPYLQNLQATGNVDSFTASDGAGTVRFELSFDVDYFPLTPAIASDVSTALAKAIANESAINDVAVKAPVALFTRNKNPGGAWTAVSGNFKRWRLGVLGANLPADKLITRWVITPEIPAAVDKIYAMLYSRNNDANVDAVNMANDVALWAAEQVISKSALTPIATNSTFYEIGLIQPVPFLADPAKAYYVRYFARDVNGANTLIGCAQATISPATQFERGLYNANDTDASWSTISAASGFAVALRVETDAFQIRKSALPSDVGGGVLPELVSTPVISLASPSALSTTVSGYFRQGGTNTPVSTVVNYPAAATGKDRVDQLVMNRSTAAVTLIAGTERTAQIDSMEWMGAVPANSIVIARALVSETKAIAVNTAQFRSLIRIGSEGEYLAHVARNNRLLRRTIAKALRGAPIRQGGYGDSITGLQGGGTPPYTANGDSRDRIGYVANYPADMRGRIPTFNLGRGVTDNVKIGWNWAIKAALDAMAGAEVVEYRNYGIGSTNSSASQSPTPGDGKDNGLYPARIAVPLGDALDLVVIAFGMNERGSSTTYGNLVNMVGQFQAAGAEVVLMGCPRPGTGFAGTSSAAWLLTERAIEAAALDSGAAYVSVKMMAEDQFLGAIGIPAEALGATNINVAANHPGVFELAQLGRGAVSQLGL